MRACFDANTIPVIRLSDLVTSLYNIHFYDSQLTQAVKCGGDDEQ